MAVQKPKITKIDVQTDTDKTVFITWSWNKSNTDKFQVRWYYGTGDGVKFVGTEEEVDSWSKQSVYSAPSNATVVKVKVKPISKTKTVNKKEVSYWTADWSTEAVYYFKDNPPVTPPVPTVEIKDYTLTSRVDNVKVNATQIQFQIVQNDLTVYKTGTSTIEKSSASYACTISSGYNYKVRCRSKDGSEYSKWSEYSTNEKTKPNPPANITECKATSETSVRLSWEGVSPAESYDIEYAVKKEYLGDSNASTTINSVLRTHYEITGLESGETYFFRVRAVNEKGTSDWCEATSVAIGKTPEAPTTWSSTTTAIVGEIINLYWTHNAEDGSNEVRAELYLDINIAGNSDIMIENKKIIILDDPNIEDDENNHYSLSTSGYTEGSTIKWKVRTAGVTGEYGEWSIERTIDVYAPPSLAIRLANKQSSDLDTIDSFPFYVIGVAGPVTQTVLGYHVSIIANESYETVDEIGNVKMISKGQEVYSSFIDTNYDLVLEMTPTVLDLENNIEYTLVCVVTMNSGLIAEEKKNFLVSWEDVLYYPNAEIMFDEDNLCAHIRAYCDENPILYYKVEYDATYGQFYRTSATLEILDGEAVRDAFTEMHNDTVYYGRDKNGNDVYFCIAESEESVLVENVTLSVFRREYDGRFVEIASGLNNTDNTYVTDPHPSLDFARYRVVAIDNTTGAVSYSDIPGYYVGVKSVVIQWEESWGSFQTTSEEELDEVAWAGSMLKLPYNIDVSDSNNIDVSLVEYIGRSHPVSYYGTQLGTTSTWNMDIGKNDTNTLYALRRLAIYMGDVYVREPSGSGYWANIKVSFSQKHLETTIPITIQINRVIGGM